jgi:transcriptional regulator
MSPFDAEPHDIAALIAAYPLAWVVSGGPADFAATPLPLLAETDTEGRIVSLFGHFALSNPQVEMLRRSPGATILFQGPNGYISPTLVSNPTWGATWNYAVARFDVDLEFLPEETGEAVWRLAQAVEKDIPPRWTPAAMQARYDELIQHIIAFRATVRTTVARFKLGQDENDRTFDEIVAGLADGELAAWMTRMARSRERP